MKRTTPSSSKAPASRGARELHTVAERLTELRRLAARFGLPLELVDRLSLRPGEVAKGTGFSTSKVNEWIATGRLPSVKIDGSVTVLMVDLLGFLEDHRRDGSVCPSRSPKARALELLGELP